MVYLHDDWLNRVFILSKFNFFKKMVRQVMIPFFNLLFIATEKLWPVNKRLFLNTIIVAEKIEDCFKQ
jgi:hypothetical protein